jgi:hypothetical protein
MITNDQPNGDFLQNMSVSILGLTVSVIDLFKGGTVVLGLVGATFATLAGWEAWRSKRLEHRLRKLELDKLEKP